MLKKIIVISAVMAAITTSAYAEGTIISIVDHTKTVIKRSPFNVEVCSEVDVQRDKTHDTLLGALIGGAIGQNITKDLPDGATAGAIIGGILGNQNSTVNGTEMSCRTMTRYKESMETMYSHSVITFRYNGRTYNTKFKK
tara:strand:+ start:370 stop:789 length:420 start_codon:yes stop_codon:yes gene_type:complete